MTYEPEQVQSAISPNLFTAQEPGISSNAEITNFWNRVSFLKHSDATLMILGTAISYDILATSEHHPPELHSIHKGNWFNPYNVLRVNLHDHLINIAPLFAPDRCVDAIGALFGFTCYIVTQHALKISTFLILENFFLYFLWNFVSLYQLNIDFLKNNQTEFSSSRIFWLNHIKKSHSFSWCWTSQAST